MTIETSTEERSAIVIRFAGDSGDGMQLAGNRFTDASALFGNDLATLPDFPAEIRAPAGTLPGVSSFQVQIASDDILTPGDAPEVLIAMNPAALKSNLRDVPKGGLIVINSDAFVDRNLTKAGYETNPLDDGSLEGYQVLTAPMEELTKLAVKESGVTGRGVLRSKNFFALGLVSWMFSRPMDSIIEWVNDKFGKLPEVAAANTMALKAGYNYGLTTEAFHHTYTIEPAQLPSGEYTNITGNQSISWGLVAGAEKANLPLFYASYPITPASSVLEELSRHKNFGVRTFQAEDEIAAAGIALGASFAGHLAVTGTSGPGIALKGETISLGFIMELPMVILNVQRAGPSTGMPTKVEQADLLMTLFGRHGEAPLPVVAAATPSDAFDTAIEACRLALKYMTPVMLMSDGYIANSSEPWKLPDLDAIPSIDVSYARATADDFLPYLRNPETLARPWAIPGTPGLEHRIGGLEKADLTGNVSYDAENHERMTYIRADKVDRIANDIPDVEVYGPEDAEFLVVGWGSTFGAIRAAVKRSHRNGIKVSHAHLRHLNPFPRNFAGLMERYDKVLVPELNAGQLSLVLRAKYLKPVIQHNKIQGLPFTAAEIEAKIREIA